MNVKLQVWIDIAGIVLEHGIPAVREIISTWSDQMTPEEIRAKVKEYQAKLKSPEEYFKKPDGKEN